MFVTEYPQLCNKDTFGERHEAISNDVQLIGEDVFVALPIIDLITAGWECKVHASARQGKGLPDPRSILFL